VRLRHTLSAQRGEWQQRIQATLYHHGCPQRRSLLVGDGREWLASQPLPAAAREQCRDLQDRTALGPRRHERKATDWTGSRTRSSPIPGLASRLPIVR
jgi:hypothetical protein